MKYKLTYYGEEVLRKTAEAVKDIDRKTFDLIESMYNIMYQENGFGLAAPQVGVSKRIIVLDIESRGGPRMALINPTILQVSEETAPYEEGCLSLPSIYAEIIRPAMITVKYTTPEGKEITVDADNLLARVLQHEIDHLNGKLFIDYLEDHIKKELTSELKKIKKLNRAS